MDEGPTSSKRVRFGGANFESTLQKWFEEAVSDNSDIESECNENFAIECNHNSESEIEDNLHPKVIVQKQEEMFDLPVIQNQEYRQLKPLPRYLPQIDHMSTPLGPMFHHPQFLYNQRKNRGMGANSAQLYHEKSNSIGSEYSILKKQQSKKNTPKITQKLDMINSKSPRVYSRKAKTIDYNKSVQASEGVKAKWKYFKKKDLQKNIKSNALSMFSIDNSILEKSKNENSSNSRSLLKTIQNPTRSKGHRVKNSKKALVQTNEYIFTICDNENNNIATDNPMKVITSNGCTSLPIKMKKEFTENKKLGYVNSKTIRNDIFTKEMRNLYPTKIYSNPTYEEYLPENLAPPTPFYNNDVIIGQSSNNVNLSGNYPNSSFHFGELTDLNNDQICSNLSNSIFNNLSIQNIEMLAEVACSHLMDNSIGKIDTSNSEATITSDETNNSNEELKSNINEIKIDLSPNSNFYQVEVEIETDTSDQLSTKSSYIASESITNLKNDKPATEGGFITEKSKDFSNLLDDIEELEKYKHFNPKCNDGTIQELCQLLDDNEENRIEEAMEIISELSTNIHNYRKDAELENNFKTFEEKKTSGSHIENNFDKILENKETGIPEDIENKENLIQENEENALEEFENLFKNKKINITDKVEELDENGNQSSINNDKVTNIFTISHSQDQKNNVDQSTEVLLNNYETIVEEILKENVNINTNASDVKNTIDTKFKKITKKYKQLRKNKKVAVNVNFKKPPGTSLLKISRILTKFRKTELSKFLNSIIDELKNVALIKNNEIVSNISNQHHIVSAKPSISEIKHKDASEDLISSKNKIIEEQQNLLHHQKILLDNYKNLIKNNLQESIQKENKSNGISKENNTTDISKMGDYSKSKSIENERKKIEHQCVGKNDSNIISEEKEIKNNSSIEINGGNLRTYSRRNKILLDNNKKQGIDDIPFRIDYKTIQKNTTAVKEEENISLFMTLRSGKRKFKY